MHVGLKAVGKLGRGKMAKKMALGTGAVEVDVLNGSEIRVTIAFPKGGRSGVYSPREVGEVASKVELAFDTEQTDVSFAWGMPVPREMGEDFVQLLRDAVDAAKELAEEQRRQLG